MWFSAENWPRNAFNDAVAVGIAVAKATFVALFFMHVKGSTKMIKIAVFSALDFLLILFSITLVDYFTRGWIGVPGK